MLWNKKVLFYECLGEDGFVHCCLWISLTIAVVSVSLGCIQGQHYSRCLLTAIKHLLWYVSIYTLWVLSLGRTLTGRDLYSEPFSLETPLDSMLLSEGIYEKIRLILHVFSASQHLTHKLRTLIQKKGKISQQLSLKAISFCSSRPPHTVAFPGRKT